MISLAQAASLLLLEGFLLTSLRSAVVRKNVALTIVVVAVLASFFWIANMDDARVTVTRSAQRSKAAAWAAVGVLLTAAALQVRYPRNTVEETLRRWNTATSGALVGAALLLGATLFIRRH